MKMRAAALVLVLTGMVLSAGCRKSVIPPAGTPDSVHAAQALYDRHEFGAAREAFSQAAPGLRGTPEGDYAEMMVGLCYQALGDLDKAEEAFRAYFRDYKPSAAGTFYFGHVLARRGKAKEAGALFEKAMRAPDARPWVIDAARAGLLKLKGAPKAAARPA